MRKTESGGKTPSTMALSSWALSRSCPKGFSITTRRQVPGRGSDRPLACSRSHTGANHAGGMDR